MPIELLTADVPGIEGLFGPPQWGIFGQDGSEILTVDSIASVEYARDYQISDYPQEKGAFESYNKVQVPYQAKVGFYIGPSRFDFLNAIEDAVASLDFVTVVTPEISYPQANLTHYSYRREARNGVTLIRVDVWCEEVRIVAEAAFESTQSTNAAPATQSGQVQSTPMIQKAPAATDTSVGGGYAPVQGQVAGSTENPELNVQGSGPGGFTSLPNVGSTTPDLPAGVPNATGGGASALSTPVSNYIDPAAAAGF